MSLTLSSTDLARLEAALSTLLSPLSYPRVDDWRSATREVVGRLIGADQSASILPMPGEPLFEVHPGSEPALRAYEHYFHTRDFVLTERRRERALEVYHRDMLYEPGEMAWDELYQDWCIPYRLHDTLGMGFQTDEGALPAALHFYHDRDSSPSFGERGVAILRLLLPAFKAGVLTCLRLAQHRTSLERAIDCIEEGLGLFDLDGRILHANPSFTRALAADPEHERIEAQVASLVSCLAELGRRARTRSVGPVVTLQAVRELRTARGRYRVRGSVLTPGLVTPGGAVLVGLEPVRPEPLSNEALRARFGLTPREVQVTRLLAAGRSDAEIARALGVSVYTARRHTEHVRMKLGVHSRAAVGAKLSAGGETE